MSSANSNVLLVEDNPGDARLIQEMLADSDGDSFRLWRADRLSAGLDMLSSGDIGVVLLDLSLPDSLGIETFCTMFAHAPQVPIIVLTGTDDEVMALHAVKTGAQDYLVKGEVNSNLLLRAMRYAMERKEAERALRESEERYALAAAGANDGLWDWHLQRGRAYFSPRWKSMLGFADDEIGDDPEAWLALIHTDDITTVRTQLANPQTLSGAPLNVEYRIRTRNGDYRWMLCRGMAVCDRDGLPLRMAGSQTDIHARKLAEERLLRDSLHDGLTGLPNRNLVTHRLHQSIEHMQRQPERRFAVLFLDLDRFKNVNDSLGHTTGDKLLIECGRRLGLCCRPHDTLARLGGDEFVLLLEDINNATDAIRVADRIQRHFATPFLIDGYELFMNCSIGIALSTPEYHHADELLRDADTAMYRAKADGKACYALFDADMHHRAVAALDMESSLRRSIDREGFELHYQPVIELQTGRISSFEALIRWPHETRGLISPAEFIPLAEETSLILPIGRWALREACRQLRQWQTADVRLAGLGISVNLSARQFSDEGLVGQVADVLEETGLPPACLKLEITESVLMVNAQLALSRLTQLRAMGIGISMDDFGTGYSSLSYLQRFPIDTLKIDQSFIAAMAHTVEGAEIVRAILNLGKALHLEVIAEGAESAAQVNMLQDMGCPLTQGYFFSRPLPHHEAETLLRSTFLTR
ncbi:MAG: EAL domain-containing protein [Zoogloea sp.]|uniref:putative bifunctional diguanylate cyclase/phosphodiesterase n=1 Tax=Zoogloea sp. TaxID=49181 RepID=UPI00261A1F26|nr:EAL domain-containing protein [Zoogloea sp.]MDD2989532.1 EAL domain-containing protein [Zoogloea sp.]